MKPFTKAVNDVKQKAMSKAPIFAKSCILEVWLSFKYVCELLQAELLKISFPKPSWQSRRIIDGSFRNYIYSSLKLKYTRLMKTRNLKWSLLVTFKTDFCGISQSSKKLSNLFKFGLNRLVSDNQKLTIPDVLQ